MPNKHSDAMRVFTKILKPPCATLRKQGFISVIFIDGFCLQGTTRDEYPVNMHESVSSQERLGFTIHQEK